LLGGVGGFAVLAAVIFLTQSSYRTDGPWQTGSQTQVEFPSDDGQTVTWGMPLPRNPTITPITVISVDPVNVTGLVVVGDGISKIDQVTGSGSIVNGPVWPPAGTTVEQPGAVILPVVGSGGYDLQVLFGVRRQTASAAGTIGGIRVRYRIGSDTYEVVFPWGLKLDPPPSPS
jgi:hypothetical protein